MSFPPRPSRPSGARRWPGWTLAVVLFGLLAMHGLASGFTSASAAPAARYGGTAEHHRVAGHDGGPTASHRATEDPGPGRADGTAYRADSAPGEAVPRAALDRSPDLRPAVWPHLPSGSAEHRVDAPCHHLDGAGHGGHLSHADATCAAAGTVSPPQPSPPLACFDLVAGDRTAGGWPVVSTGDGGSSPSLSQLQILRV